MDLPPPSPLAGEVRADVCVVGAGFTGLSAALHLAERGYDVVLLEARRAGWGASGRNGGQVGRGQRVDQPTLEARYGAAVARQLWEIGGEARALVGELIARHRIACDVRPGILHAVLTEAEARDCAAEVAHMRKVYGAKDITFLDRAGTEAAIDSPRFTGAMRDGGGAHLNPLAYARGLAEAAEAAGVRLHEGTRVTALSPGRVTAEAGAVAADHVLLATNGYLGGLAPAVGARVMPINNFIVATEPLDRRRMPGGEAVADSRFVVRYFREDAAGRLIFGGGETYGYRFPRDIRALVRPALEEVFPDLAGVALTHAWGGTLAITRSRLPHFVRLAPGVLSAAGYSGHGVAMATLAGKLMAEAVAGQAERFDVFASLPAPRFPGGDALRQPMLVLAMTWYALRDRLG